jgi:hypothetical protein
MSVAGDEAVPREGVVPAGVRGEEVVEDVVRLCEDAEGGVEVTSCRLTSNVN